MKTKTYFAFKIAHDMKFWDKNFLLKSVTGNQFLWKVRE